MKEQKQRIFDRIDQNADAIRQRSRRLFDTPELGYREFETGRLIQDWLTDWGVAWTPVSFQERMRVEELPGASSMAS